MSETTTTSATGAATGGVKILLRLEGLTLFAGMTLLYAVWGGSWWIYLILFLVPDLSFAAYLANPKIGAVVYNAAHSYMAPVAMMTSSFALASPFWLSIALIWMAPSAWPAVVRASSVWARFAMRWRAVVTVASDTPAASWACGLA